MTSKTTKYKTHYGLIAIVAASLIGGILVADQQAEAGTDSFNLTASGSNQLESAKITGTPYLKSNVLPHTQLLSDGKTNQILVELTLISENTDAKITVKPTVNGQFLILDNEVAKFSEEQIRNALETREMLTGMYDKSEFVSFSVDRVTLLANEPQQIMVNLSLDENLTDKYSENPFRVNIGYELINSNVGDKIPRDYESIEIRSQNAN